MKEDSRVNRRRIAIVLAAVLAILLSAGAWWLLSTYPAPEPTSAPVTTSRAIDSYEDEIESARRLLHPMVAAYPAISVSVGVGRDIVWSEGIGYSDLGAETPVLSTARFRIYSLSKPITAAAAVCLREQGKLDLDEPVTDRLGYLPDHYSGVTARYLIGHLAGARHCGEGEWPEISRAGCDSPADALEAFIDDPLIHPPGEGYHYSGFGYVLLSAVIEEAAGAKFEQYLREEIFKPAWMHNTGMEGSGSGGPNIVTFYRKTFLGRFAEAREIDNTCKWGAGGLLSCSDDLVRFALALIGGRILAQENVEGLFAPVGETSAGGSGYGFGWGLGVDGAGRRYAVHGGGAIGGRGALYVLLDEKVAVAVLASADGPGLTDEAGRIAGIFCAD